MPTTLKLRRGTTSGNDAFTGAEGEVTYDTQRKTLRTHDGATAGGVELAKASTVAQKNLLYNGAWLIDQINEGALYTCTGAAVTVQTVDGWSGFTAATPGAFKVRRLADPDFPSQMCLEVTCTTVDSTIAAGDRYLLFTAIEGYDAADLRAGTASAKQITISFDMKFSLTGTYGISISNSAGSRTYVGTVTQNSANVRESKTVTLTMDTAGTWLYNDSVGLQLRFCLASGSTFQATAGAWNAGNFDTTSAQANFMSSTSNIGYLGRIKLEQGAVVTPWHPDDMDYAKVLAKAQEYYFKTFQQGSPVQQNGGVSAGCIGYRAHSAGAIVSSVGAVFPTTMRATPTITFYNPAAANSNWRNSNTAADSGASAADNVGMSGVIVNNAQAGGDSIQNLMLVHMTANARLS